MVAQPGGDLVGSARLVAVAMFAVLALIAVVRARRGGRAGLWAAAAFGSLAIGLLMRWAGDAFGADLPVWLGAAAAVMFVAVPYLLLRFTAVFTRLPRWVEATAGTAAIGAEVATLVLLVVPETAIPESASAALYVAVIVVYWVPVSLVTIATLWRAGRGQPTIARRRMRLLSAATAVLAATLLATLVLGDASASVHVTVKMIAAGSGAAFALGLSPPHAMRLSWRRAEEQRLQDAMLAVLCARTVQDVADELLPPTVRIVGGSGAALIDARGRIMAAHGDTVDLGPGPNDTDPDSPHHPARQVIPLSEGRGELTVWTSPYTPFFGRDELDLLRTMSAVMSLALERCERLEDERAQLLALERAQQHAEQAREEATRANQAKNEFLSRMSHELRTPLNAILGFGQLLETAALTDDDRDGVGHILKAGGHLLQLINDVLDLSRIEAGTMTLSLEPVHASELIDDAASLIQPLADSRSIRLTVNTEGCDAYVMTDRQRCRQVLLNLLSNAVKYNYDGGAVQIGCDHVDARTLRISVADTGPGIDPARRQRLFDPFDRLGAETTGVEGTGLGLALTRQLIEHMAGAIGVNTASGQGSTFWVDLPITHQPAAVDAPPVQPRTAHDDTDQRTLLLVEDNLANQRLVQAMLRRRPGISVLPAMQGSLALELAYEHQPDIIVLDLHLPDLSGREVLQRLRADPRTHNIPVVIASADASPGRVRQLREEGAFAYLTKPLDLTQFLNIVAAGLAHHDQIREQLDAGSPPTPDPALHRTP